MYVISYIEAEHMPENNQNIQLSCRKLSHLLDSLFVCEKAGDVIQIKFEV